VGTKKSDPISKEKISKEQREETSMSKAMDMASQGGGHLYMQTNEIRNAIVHYRWSKSGTLTEVERVPTGGAGSGTFKPISGQESARNAFEGPGSIVLSPMSSPCDGRDGAKLQSAAAETGTQGGGR
jgi:hypothetical protein